MSESRPGFWMYETTGVLRPAMEAYLLGNGPLSPEHAAAIRAYLRQWINAPVWRGPEVETLRARIDGLIDRKSINAWLDLADEIGIDPL